MQRRAFLTWLDDQGGVAHSSAAREAGYSGRAVADAVASGHARRVRRSWIAARAAPADLVAAAQAGGRLTCVSAARRLGFWLPPSVDAAVHVALTPTASRVGVRDDLVLHWSRGVLPVRRDAITDHVFNVLLHVSRCLTRRDAFAVWESAVRLKAVSPDMLRRTRWGSTAAGDLAMAVGMLSDSGIESIFVLGMRELRLPVAQQVWIDGHPLDAMIGDNLLVQLDGFSHHSQPLDRRRDLRADARLALLGYTVFRFDWYQVLFAWDEVADTVLTAVAQGLHLRRPAVRR
jgi:very-short-patch-repair endonuclease